MAAGSTKKNLTIVELPEKHDFSSMHRKAGSLELAGGALAIGFTNITGYSVLFGLAMGMEPLCSQAFGSKNFTMQRDNMATTLVHSACNTSTLSITVFFTFHQHLGIQGVAISTFIANLNILLFLLGYINYAHDEKTSLSKSLVPSSNKLGSTTALWEEWGMLLRLAIPSCLGVCLEWWWYELMTLLAGYLYKPHVALATSAIVIQTTSLMYTLPSALSASISTRVGNELGAGRPQKARLATAVVIALAFSTSIFGFLLTTLGRGAWGRVFTNDNEVLELTMAVLPIIGLCELANCPQTTCCGVLRGSARPSTGAGINFCSFYLMGTPVAVALAFCWELGFLGLCYGLLAAQVACLLSILKVIHETDWENESLRAKNLIGISNEYVHADLLVKCEEGVSVTIY
ncbi:UNVERIFIED_CONTAM: protein DETOXIFICATION 55 [Sesamum angustifolium]|uniref:Protein DETOXIFICATION 55 n=1 Tax=Sesamum angustifolium TaxID=2727405 RepID=A0AAW2P1J0_9LAMI